MRVKMTIAVLAMASLALSLPATSAANRSVKVKSGESIQAAIDDARPGTTIKIEEGTYNEALRIDKDGIELVGEGRKKTNLVPPAGAPTDCVFAPAGICVTDATDPDHAVDDVEISNLSVKGFVFGIFYFNTEDGEITRVIASDNDAYGIFFNDSTGAKISRNVTANDGEAGIYVGDSANADATVWKNVAYENTFGVFIRDAAHGKVLDNKTFSNCAGILFLNTDETTGGGPPGAPPAPVIDAKDWLAQGNLAAANNNTCPGDEEEGEPPFGGVGIAVFSALDIRLFDNGVYGNKATIAPDPNGIPSAGILVGGDPTFIPASGAKVGFNQALGNATDIVWDEQGDGNSFFANDCLTSQPDGLCDESDHSGDHHGDNGDHHGDGGHHNGGDRDHGDRHHEKSKKHKSSRHSKHKKRYKHHDD
jgi:Right handed beta helix region